MLTELSSVLTMKHFTAFLPLLVAFLTWESTKAEIIGTINVEPIGTIYVWKQFGNVVMEGNGVRMTADSRVYLLSKEVSTLSPDAFWQVNLDEQHFTYDLNLSGVPCHCNAAGYFIKMPAPNAGGGGDYYCDANYVGGQG